jgi:hypothetical protein
LVIPVWFWGIPFQNLGASPQLFTEQGGYLKDKYRNNYVAGQLFDIKENYNNGLIHKKIAINNGEYILLYVNDSDGKRVFMRYTSGGGGASASTNGGLTLYPRDNKYVDIHRI